MENITCEIYNKLIREITSGYGISSELMFSRDELEREQLHSEYTLLFGTRVPPQETTSLLNIFKIVSQNLPLPNSFHQDYSLRYLYRASCLSFYMREYEKAKTLIDKDDYRYKISMDDGAVANNNVSSVLNITKEMNEYYNDDNDNNHHHNDIYNQHANIKRLVLLVLKALDDNDHLQNVWHYKLQYRRQQQEIITDEDLNHILYVCIRSGFDPSLTSNDFRKKYPLLPRTIPTLIYLTCFCYKLLLPFILLEKK